MLVDRDVVCDNGGRSSGRRQWTKSFGGTRRLSLRWSRCWNCRPIVLSITTELTTTNVIIEAVVVTEDGTKKEYCLLERSPDLAIYL